MALVMPPEYVTSIFVVLSGTDSSSAPLALRVFAVSTPNETHKINSAVHNAINNTGFIRVDKMIFLIYFLP